MVLLYGSVFQSFENDRWVHMKLYSEIAKIDHICAFGMKGLKNNSNKITGKLPFTPLDTTSIKKVLLDPDPAVNRYCSLLGYEKRIDLDICDLVHLQHHIPKGLQSSCDL